MRALPLAQRRNAVHIALRALRKEGLQVRHRVRQTQGAHGRTDGGGDAVRGGCEGGRGSPPTPGAPARPRTLPCPCRPAAALGQTGEVRDPVSRPLGMAEHARQAPARRAIWAVLAGGAALCALVAWRPMPARAGVALASRFDAKLSRSLQQLDHRLTQSAWRLSTPQLGSAAARGSAVARQQGGR